MTERERWSDARDAFQSGESSVRICSEPRRIMPGGEGGEARGDTGSSPLQRRTVSMRRKRRDGGGDGAIALTERMSSAASCARPAMSSVLPVPPPPPPACSLRSVAAISTFSPLSCVAGKRRTQPESSGRSPEEEISGVAGGSSSGVVKDGGGGANGVLGGSDESEAAPWLEGGSITLA